MDFTKRGRATNTESIKKKNLIYEERVPLKRKMGVRGDQTQLKTSLLRNKENVSNGVDIYKKYTL